MTLVDLYGRVSTAEQAEEGYSIAEQEKRLRAYAEAQGWTVHGCYMDGGFSGANLNRPGLQSMIRDVESHAVQKVVVFKLDRLSRSQKDTLKLIEDIFTPNGVSFVSMSETLDTGTPFGIAMIGILSVFAQLERETIKERMKIGRDARVKSGKFHGGGNVPIGLRYENKILTRDEYDASVLYEIFKRYAAGATASSIATYLNNEIHWRTSGWTAEKVKRLITNPIYIGLQRWKGETIAVENCPLIIPNDLFESVQKEIARRSSKLQKPQSPHRHTTLLGGLLWCGCCGQRYTGMSDRQNDGSVVYRYYCYGRIMRNHKFGNHACSNRSWRADQLDDIILGELSKLSIQNDVFDPGIRSSMADQISAVNTRLKELDQQEARLIDLYAIGSMNPQAIQTKMNAIQSERAALREQIAEMENLAGALSTGEVKEKITAFSEILAKSADKMQLYDVIHQLVHSVTLTNDNVEICWNFNVGE